MLSVKLHRKKRPWLGRGSHLVPILRWDLAKVRIKNWIRLLESGWRGTNHTIRYLTLVRIPDDHPVALQHDWDDKMLGLISGEPVARDAEGRAVFPALSDVPAEWKAELMRWTSGGEAPYGSRRAGGPKLPLPEVILGAPLPASRILWTKSRLLLFRGDRRE